MPDEVETTKILEMLSAKVDDLSKALMEKKGYTEDKIKENPLAYVAGAFTGGLIIGYLMARRKDWCGKVR